MGRDVLNVVCHRAHSGYAQGSNYEFLDCCKYFTGTYIMILYIWQTSQRVPCIHLLASRWCTILQTNCIDPCDIIFKLTLICELYQLRWYLIPWAIHIACGMKNEQYLKLDIKIYDETCKNNIWIMSLIFQRDRFQKIFIQCKKNKDLSFKLPISPIWFTICQHQTGFWWGFIGVWRLMDEGYWNPQQ